MFDFGKFTNERDHIQKIMEDSFWLFGEQYNAVVEDKTWSKSLESYYIKILEKDNLPKPLEDSEANRRPDLFLARKIRHISNPETRLEENIILELKEPRVKIGMEQYRQVQDYLELVKRTPEFTAHSRKWKFIVIGKELSIEIIDRIRAREAEGREPYTVETTGNFSIHAMTWSDVFLNFDLNNSFLIEHIDFDKEEIKKQLESNGVDLKEIANHLVNQKASILTTN